MERALLATQPGGHRAQPGLTCSGPAPQQPGRSRRRKGRRGSHAPPKACLFRLFGEKGRRAPSTKLKRKPTPEAGQGAPRSQSRRRWCRSTYLQSSRECPVTAGGGDARAIPGASKWLSTDQVLCSCSVRGKTPAELQSCAPNPSQSSLRSGLTWYS